MSEPREVYLRDPLDPRPVPDCTLCGACCRQAASDGRILVYEEDLVRWRREKRPDILDLLVDGHFGERAFAATPEGHCVHLGTAESPHLCAIYDTRGLTCHRLEPGSPQCFEYREQAGLDDPPPEASDDDRR